jgi:hypothetical protein
VLTFAVTGGRSPRPPEWRVQPIVDNARRAGVRSRTETAKALKVTVGALVE